MKHDQEHVSGQFLFFKEIYEIKTKRNLIKAPGYVKQSRETEVFEIQG